MKRLVTMIALAVLVSGAASEALAQELSLDDCIELALKNRASIIRARGAETSAAAGSRAALGAFLPRIRGSYSYGKGKETDIFPPNVQYGGYEEVLDTFVVNGDTAVDHRFAGTDPIFTTEQESGPNKSWSLGADASIGLDAFFDYAAAKAYRSKAKLDVIASEQDLIYAVKVSYYAYLANVQNLVTQQQAVKRADEQLKLIESKFELGSAAKSDVLKQKVLFGNDRLSLLRAENAVSNSKASLAYTVGLDPRGDQEFSAVYTIREYDGTQAEAIEFSVSHNPSLLSQQKMVDYARHNARSAKASYLPYLSGSYSWSKFNGTQGFPYNFDYSSKNTRWGFALNLNIFDGFFREKRVADANVSYNNSRADFSDLKNRTISDVRVAHLEIDQFKQQKSVSEENVAAADEDLKITQEKYNLGAATILDLLDAQVSLKQAQVSLISVDFDLNLAIAKLEKSMGKM